MVKVTGSCQACYEFATSTSEDPPCRVDQCMLSMSRFKHSSVGVEVRKKECHSRHLTMVQNYEVRRQKPWTT
ncbi:hypothetical protein TNCV_1012731 [Trichonephila clavipes]|uniref:Uncharacterized protein n=1 Tax=Trichonephila clavipes TaxID=2585209 RepID=A0A8X6VXH2_TRICX|nr:hypothetical protein TNCV_1012731 [Trichonephila clavipes]